MFISPTVLMLDVQCATTNISKFSFAPSVSHYKLLRGVTKYLCSLLINQGIRYTVYWRKYCILNYSIWKIYSLFLVDVNCPVLQTFIDATFGISLTWRRFITGIIFTYCGGTIIYLSKTQTLIAQNSTKAEFIATITVVKLAFYLCCVLKQLD